MSELKRALAALGVTVNDQEARQMFSAIDIDSKKNCFINKSDSFSFFRKWFVIGKEIINKILFLIRSN